MPLRTSNCYSCGKEVELLENQKIGVREECESCGVDLHCCLSCEFYDERAHNGCRETSAERVVDKAKANFCDFHRYAAEPGNSDVLDKKKEQLKKADDLFK